MYSLCTEIFEESSFPEWQHGCVGFCWIIKPHCPLSCCLYILFAYCAWDEKVMCSEPRKSLCCPAPSRKACLLASVWFMEEESYHLRLGKLFSLYSVYSIHGGRRRQLKGRDEFEIIPEYIRCTQLFLIQCSRALRHLLGRGNRTRLCVSSPETFIPVRLRD